MRTCLVPFIISYHIISRELKSEDHGDPFCGAFVAANRNFLGRVRWNSAAIGEAKGGTPRAALAGICCGALSASQCGRQSADAGDERSQKGRKGCANTHLGIPST